MARFPDRRKIGMVNEAFYSASIFGGQAAHGDAQAANPRTVEAALATGKPTTNAAATVTATYEGLAADAKQKGIYADAAVESEQELLAKKRKHIPLSSTGVRGLREDKIGAGFLPERKNPVAKAAPSLHFLRPAVIQRKEFGFSIMFRKIS